MSILAAVIGSWHLCPRTAEKIPNVDGPVIVGSSVYILSMRAVRVGDKVVRVDSPDNNSDGSSSVKINGKPAMRVGGFTTHGVRIFLGIPLVPIGG